VDASRV